MKPDPRTLTIRLNKTETEQAKALARERGVSLTKFVQQILVDAGLSRVRKTA